MNEIVTEKVCSVCRKSKPVTEFYPDRHNHKLCPSCKECVRIYHKTWRETDGNKEKEALRKRKWQEDNKERIKEKYHRRYIINKEQMKVRNKKWLEDNPDKRELYRKKRRDLIKASNSNVTSKEWMELCRIYDYKCLCCGRDNVVLTQDHVIPVSLGGRHEIGNMQPLCQSCNSAKGKTSIDYREIVEGNEYDYDTKV